MQGFKPKNAHRKGYANGGMVRGPGTGTSDDIEDEIPPGTFIMPADSTQAVGPENLEQMGGAKGFTPGGAKVPVNLSNGEYKMPPEQVHAVGVQALNQMKDATHTPVPQGFAPQGGDGVREPQLFLANGGTPEEERARLANQTAMYVQGAQAAAANRPPEPTAAPAAAPAPAQSEYGRQMAAVGGALADGAAWLAKTAVSAPGYGFNRGDAAATPAAPTAPAAPAAATSPAAPAAPANPTDARLSTGTQQAPAGFQPVTLEPQPMGDRVAAQAQSMATGSRQVAPGIYRNGNSYGDSPAAAAGFAPAGAQPSAQNMQAADNLAATSAARGFTPGGATAQPAGVAAPVVRTSVDDWQTRKNIDNLRTSALSITTNGGRFDRTRGNNAAQAEFRAAVQADAAARGAQATADVAAMQANAGIQREQIQQAGGITRENIQQTGANGRAAAGFNVDRERLGIDRSRVASENSAREVSTQGAQQLQQLRNVLVDPKSTPEQRKQAEASLRAIGGRPEAANRYTVVPGGQEVSPQGIAYTRPSQVIDNQTGQFVQQAAPQQAPQAPPVAGKVYTDAKGNRARWDGTKYVPA